MNNDNNSLAHTKWNCKYHIVFCDHCITLEMISILFFQKLYNYFTLTSLYKHYTAFEINYFLLFEINSLK